MKTDKDGENGGKKNQNGKVKKDKTKREKEYRRKRVGKHMGKKERKNERKREIKTLFTQYSAPSAQLPPRKGEQTAAFTSVAMPLPHLYKLKEKCVLRCS